MMQTNKLRQSPIEIELPASKSISNRMLLIQALSAGDFSIENLSTASDTRTMQQALEHIRAHSNSKVLLELDVQDAGTAFRFLTAFLSRRPGRYLLTGTARMQERPIGILVDALRELGARISYTRNEGFPPLLIQGGRLQSGSIRIPSHFSSQYISALLMIGPLLPDGLEVIFNQKPASEPYIKMTIALMRQFGITVDYQGLTVNVAAGTYQAQDFRVEHDWSSAAFFYESLAFATEGSILLKGLHLNSIQGDARLMEIYRDLGVESTETKDGILLRKSRNIRHNITLDFRDIPDLAIPVIATCAGLGLIGRFTGLESLKIKESDRIAALEKELARLGFDFRETDEHEWVLINSCNVGQRPEPKKQSIKIEHYNDHRIAMSFAPFRLLGYQIEMEKTEVVRKSFPDFWEMFAHIEKQNKR